MAELDRYALGRTGEEAAVLYLKKKGYRIVGRNVRIGRSEIDIICENDLAIVFAEVKTRRQTPDTKSPFGSPASAVDEKKQNALIRGADGYIKTNPTEKFPRIDVIEVYVSDDDVFSVTEIRHLENAVRKTGKFTKNNLNRRNRHETD
ncbi:MAG: YraN family protein [Clostridia bacterium]|nr:YraN family protein [Clostridia bacterium]